VAILLLAAWLANGHIGRSVLRGALTRAESLRGWSRRRRVDQYRLEDLLGDGCWLLGMQSLSGSTRRGKIAGDEAIVFSGSCDVVAVPKVVDRSSRIALAINTMLTKGRQDDPEDFADTTRIFATVLVVRLADAGPLVSFDLRSKDWRDGDVVYTNVDDRTEHFESIELDEHHDVRVPNTQSQLETWQAITPVVVQQLAGVRRLDIRKQGRLLVAIRVGGCGRRAELDALVDTVTWFAGGAAENLQTAVRADA
jgi:hypothetical protein